MSTDKDISNTEINEVINPDGSVIPEIEQEEQQSQSQSENDSRELQEYSISKNNIPSFKKILVTDDGRDISNKALNYAVSLSNSTGAELLILRILEDVQKFDDVSVEGYNEDSQMDHQNFHRNIKGEVIDAIEAKIKKCEEAGCKNKISYKFRAGKADDEIVNEINEGNFDLLVLTTSHIDSWVRSLFSDARKIISNVSIPVLIIQ
ncbi:MAG: universal stress protein [Deltaproteobacteria bacterium]|jgi:nucleotide-binding universal stress UspA family protein|nr:universal stress protein [Nitrososphaeraceae archaeon]